MTGLEESGPSDPWRGFFVLTYAMLSLPMWLMCIYGMYCGEMVGDIWTSSAQRVWMHSQQKFVLDDFGPIAIGEHLVFHLTPALLVGLAMWRGLVSGRRYLPLLTLGAMTVGLLLPWWMTGPNNQPVFYAGSILIGAMLDFYAWMVGCRRRLQRSD